MRTFGQFFYPSNQLTFLRLVSIPFIILAILYGQYRTALILVLIAGLSDGMDGLLARRLGQQTTLGKFLDPIADKLFLNSTFAALGFAQQLPLWLVILVLSRDVIIITIALAMLLTSSHKPCPPSSYGKANTATQIATVLLTLFMLVLPNNAVTGLQIIAVYCTAALTIASGMQYAFRTAEQLRGGDIDAPSESDLSDSAKDSELTTAQTQVDQNRLN